MSEITSETCAVATLSAYLDQLLTDKCTDELNGSENKRRAFFAFVFGGIGGLAIQDGLSPQQAQSVAIAVYCESLRLSPTDMPGWLSWELTPPQEIRSGRMRHARGSKSSWCGKLILRRSRGRTCAWCLIVCRSTAPNRDEMNRRSRAGFARRCFGTTRQHRKHSTDSADRLPFVGAVTSSTRCFIQPLQAAAK